MKRDRPIHTLVAEQLGERDGVDLIAIAHALEEEFGVALPREQLARLGSYGDLLQLLRNVLAGDAEQMSEDELAACFVRARVVASGADGRVSLVRSAGSHPIWSPPWRTTSATPRPAPACWCSCPMT